MSEAPAPAAQEPAAPTPAATPAPEAAPAAPEPERTFTQKELDDILEKRLSKERRKRDELNTRLKVTEELALKRAAQDAPQAPKQTPSAAEPTRDQYPNIPYEEFVELRAEWRANQTVDKKFKERDEADRQSKAQKEQETQREQFRKAMKESAKDIEDFDDVISDIKATDPVANVSASALEAADAPGKVLYHLIQNPDEAERIASLSPGKQAREVVKLEEKLSKPTVKPSKAPEPIKPVGGKSVVGDEMPDAAKNPEKWMEWRKRSLAAKKQGGTRAA